MVSFLLLGLVLWPGVVTEIGQEVAVGSAYPLEASPQLLAGELVWGLAWGLRNGATSIKQMLQSFDLILKCL